METDLLVKMSDSYEEKIKPALSTDTVEIYEAESSGCKKKAAWETPEGYRGMMRFTSRLIFAPLVQIYNCKTTSLDWDGESLHTHMCIQGENWERGIVST